MRNMKVLTEGKQTYTQKFKFSNSLKDLNYLGIDKTSKDAKHTHNYLKIIF